MALYTVRVRGVHPVTGDGGALLEEHEFTDEAEARRVERELVREGSGLVTFTTTRTASDGHEIDAEFGAGLVPFDRCVHCRQPIGDSVYNPGRLVTLATGNAECYGRRP